MLLQRLQKIGKRRLLARALDSAGVFAVTKALQPAQLVVFNYHRIRENQDKPTLFDDSLFGPTQDALAEEIKWMKELADPVSEEELLAHLDRGAPLPRRGFMVTFDDGYRDNFELAAPVLRAARIPAIFFIPTKAITERELGWWEHVSWCLKQTKKTEIHFRGERFRVPAAVMPLAELFNQRLKLEPAEKTATFIGELRSACEVEGPSPELTSAQLMTWEQVKAASETGITIGSHTHSHRVLATLDLETQRQELFTSKEILERHLGRSVRSLAYPVGGYEHVNLETRELARECGYHLAFSFLTGINLAGGVSRFDVKRVDRRVDRASYNGAFAMPRLFAQKTCRLNEPLSRPQNVRISA